MTRLVTIRALTRYARDGAGDVVAPDQDLVAVEAPVSLVLQPHTGAARPLGLLMRTPGHDDDLAAGVLATEGVVRHAADITRIEFEEASNDDTAPSIRVVVGPRADVNAISDRVGTATSACGLCGRLSMRQLDRASAATAEAWRVTGTVIRALSGDLRAAQHAFAQTGGLHAAAIFTPAGRLVSVREDVGRHNAVDKIAGALLRQDALPAHGLLLAVSGRVAFEIVQKAAMCGLPMIVAVGAPTDLAIDAARATGITLVGFARDGRFNVYTHPGRIADI